MNSKLLAVYSSPSAKWTGRLYQSTKTEYRWCEYKHGAMVSAVTKHFNTVEQALDWGQMMLPPRSDAKEVERHVGQEG